MTLILNTAIQYFHWIFWFVIINHQTKLGWKRIISSEDIVEIYFYCIIPHCDQLRSFPETTHAVTELWSGAKLEQFKKYHLDKKLHFECLLWSWPWTQLSHIFIGHFGLWSYDDLPHKQVWLQKNHRFTRYSTEHSYIFRYMQVIHIQICKSSLLPHTCQPSVPV